MKDKESQLRQLAITNLQLSIKNKLLLQRLYAQKKGSDVKDLQGEFDEITKLAFDQAREILGLTNN